MNADNAIGKIILLTEGIYSTRAEYYRSVAELQAEIEATARELAGSGRHQLVKPLRDIAAASPDAIGKAVGQWAITGSELPAADTA